MPMTSPDHPDIIPCELDPDFECIRVGSQAADALASPPPGGSKEEASRRLCPDGYVPRRRRERGYRLEGKLVPSEHNPGS
jgi:hypothetical protein